MSQVRFDWRRLRRGRPTHINHTALFVICRVITRLVFARSVRFNKARYVIGHEIHLLFATGGAVTHAIARRNCPSTTATRKKKSRSSSQLRTVEIQNETPVLNKVRPCLLMDEIVMVDVILVSF